MLENFTGDAYMVNCAQKINQGEFTDPPDLPKLKSYELDLLKEVIWFINNLIENRQIACDFAEH